MEQHFNEVINRRGTFCTQWDYIEDRFGEKDLLPFSISDTDFACPPAILQAMQARMDHGIFGYTRWNHDAFKNAIKDWYKRRFSSVIEEDWIVYSPSVLYSISKILQFLTDEGDHVITQTPAYDAFFKTVESHKRVLVENELLYENGTYSIDFARLESVLSHPKAKVLLLCSPHNPTGRVWKWKELQRIYELCRTHGVFILSDEIHMDLVFKRNTHIPITDVAANAHHVCICTSASKTFNTPGLGGSYCLIPDPKLRDHFLGVLKNQDGLSSASVFGTIATMTGYNECDEWVDEMVDYVENNFHTIDTFLQTHLPALTLAKSESTYLAWIDVSSLPYTSEQLQEALVHHGKVAIMPGLTYGESGRRFLRMNVGCPRSKVEDGLQRLKKTIFYLQDVEE